MNINENKTLPEINFSQIRKHQGSNHKGFEELCVQLFRSTFKNCSTFYRVDDAGGDGGVEDIAVAADQSKIGLQAKYFDKLSSTQWTQINKSVLTALRTHSPNLIEYRIACPINRPKDMKTWENYRSKWQKAAQSLGYKNSVSFVWWGDTEFRIFLSEEKNRDFLLYWFGARSLTEEWLKNKFETTLKLLDTRYTPKLHVRTNSQQNLDAFCLTNSFKRSLWRGVNAVAEKIKNFPKDSKKQRKLWSQIQKESRCYLRVFSNQQAIPSLQEFLTAHNKLLSLIQPLRDKYEELQANAKTTSGVQPSIPSTPPFNYEISFLDELAATLYSAVEFAEKYKCYDSNKVVVLGEAGSGKSHLLATTVHEALERNQPAILLLGEQINDAYTPFLQVCNNLGWEDGVQSLLGALSTRGLIYGQPAIIAIDALNESSNRKFWKSNLIQAASQIAEHSNIRLIVSCRSDFAEFVLPDSICKHQLQDWVFVNHEGFGEDTFEAVERYFKGYNVASDQFPPLLDEFKNPLFLKTFCEAFANSRVPKGTLSLDKVLKRRIDTCLSQIQKAIDCPKYKTQKAINLLSNRIAKNSGQPLNYEETRDAIDAIFDGSGETCSLYAHLRSNGLIAESIRYTQVGGSEDVVRFQYERFLDYFVALECLNDISTKEELIRKWKQGGFAWQLISSYPVLLENRGLLRMLAILLPERFGIEFEELLGSGPIPLAIYEDFLESLPWRSTDSFGTSAERLLNTCKKKIDSSRYLDTRLRLSTIPEHPYNARMIHQRLLALELWQREIVWTIPIQKSSKYAGYGTVNSILRWVFKVPPASLSDEQAWLLAILLSWFLTNNHRYLRTRATLALIRVLSGRCKMASELLTAFNKCNDPYVVERIYAAACGAAMRENDVTSLKYLAENVFKLFFSLESVPAHILQRDYARTIIEIAKYRNALPRTVNITLCRPPYNSIMPKVISEKRALQIESQDKWRAITASLRPAEMGMYGDFGRYVMESALHGFSKRTYNQTPDKDRHSCAQFSGKLGRRYILKRIQESGWTPERFYSYDHTLSHGRLRETEEKNKVERISKKYQWIALHELIGYLTDHYRLTPEWSGEEKAFKGAWQLGMRDFDPSQPLNDPDEYFNFEEPDIPNTNETQWWKNYPDIFSNCKKLIKQRVKWVTELPPDFKSLIEHSFTSDNKDWLTVSAHHSWKEQLSIDMDEAKFGTRSMWVDIRCWLIEKSYKEQFIQKLEKVHFWGNGCSYPKLDDVWMGEYPWGLGLRGGAEDLLTDGWIETFGVKAFQTTCDYYGELFSDYVRLISPFLCELLSLRWSGDDFDFVNKNGDLIAYSPYGPQQTAPLLVRKKTFLEELERKGYYPFWICLSERMCWSNSANVHISEEFGATDRCYGFDDGILKCFHEKQYQT